MLGVVKLAGVSAALAAALVTVLEIAPREPPKAEQQVAERQAAPRQVASARLAAAMPTEAAGKCRDSTWPYIDAHCATGTVPVRAVKMVALTPASAPAATPAPIPGPTAPSLARGRNVLALR